MAKSMIVWLRHLRFKVVQSEVDLVVFKKVTHVQTEAVTHLTPHYLANRLVYLKVSWKMAIFLHCEVNFSKSDRFNTSFCLLPIVKARARDLIFFLTGAALAVGRRITVVGSRLRQMKSILLSKFADSDALSTVEECNFI